MRAEAFKVEHIEKIDLQPAQQWVKDRINFERYRALENGVSATVFEGDKPLACAGAIQMWEGRYYGWALFGRVTKKQMVEITWMTENFLKTANFRRLEISVDCEFVGGHAWANRLGFVLEAPRMRGFDVDGRDCALYAMVK